MLDTLYRHNTTCTTFLSAKNLADAMFLKDKINGLTITLPADYFDDIVEDKNEIIA